MEYDKDFLKQQLSLQGITVDDEDIPYIQRILKTITQGEEEADKFSDIEDTKIILTMAMEELNDD